MARVGDFVREPDPRRATGGGVTVARGGAKGIIELAKATGKIEDRTVRQDLMRLHTLHELARMNNLRAKAARATGKDVPTPARASSARPPRCTATTTSRRRRWPR